MRFFLKHILVLFVATLSTALVLDFVYTVVIANSSERNKVEKVLHTQGKSLDVVIMGTSRANNHFVPELFEKKGYKTFNYGMSGSHLFETGLMLKLMIQHKFKIKTVLLETDLNVSNEKRDEGTTARFMPYMHTNSIIKEHYQSQEDFWKLYYLPFYRYIKFDNRIGFRELYKVLVKEPTTMLEHQGYYPLKTTNEGKMSNDISGLKPFKNKYLEEIKTICKANHIKLVLVMTPMCQCTNGMEYFEKVKKIYPEIYNFENAVTDDRYFSSCGHLNDKGAHIFTAYVLNKIKF